MDQQRDEEMVGGMARGDAGAWRALYDAHAEYLWSYIAHRMGPCSADVADVLQETFLAAARSARHYDVRQGSLRQWLTGVARRHIALWYRQQERQDRLRLLAERLGPRGEQVLRWLDNATPTPLEVLDGEETVCLIRATLAELADDHADVLTRRYLDDEKVDQIAASLRISDSAVRSRLARAREAFRRAFTLRMRSALMSPQSTDDPSP
jgi:RNA polymerase sigma-70 factor (ECF subfamily)